MLRSVFLAAAGSARLGRLMTSAPISGFVGRFVAGSEAGDALRVARQLADDGLTVTVEHLSDEPGTPERAIATRDEYVRLLSRLKGAGLAPVAEVSVKLSALGQQTDEKLTAEYARAICVAAAEAGSS